MTTTTRRTFLTATAATVAGLVIPFRATLSSAQSAGAGELRNAWLRIDGQGVVTVWLPRVEFGQGIRTAMPMILADELDVDTSAIRLDYARPGPLYDDLGTGGSDSMRYAWRVFRQAGAAARQMLREAAAEQWGVAPAACGTERGEVIHDATSRRLSYGSLVPAAAARPVPRNPVFKTLAERRIVGKPTLRVDGPDIVRGAAVYGIDLVEPGLKYACLARPPRLGATVRTFDAAAAKRVRGVISVVQVPQGVAVVAADTWAAMKGVEALVIDWAAGPTSDFSSTQAWADLEKGADAKGVETRREGDPEAARRSAARVLEATYHYPVQVHAPLEPISYIADVRDARARLAGATQNQPRVQRAVAEALGFAPENVDVGQALIGGSFGRRLRADYAVEAALISKAAGVPVKLQWTRADDTRHGHFQPASVHRMAAAIDASGKPSLWFHRQASSGGHTPPEPTAEERRDPEFFRGIGWAHHDNPYVFPAQLIEYSYVASPVVYGPWRAVFAPPAVFARESFLDEIAHALGKDPLTWRLELLPPLTTMKSGSVSIDRDRLRRVLQLAGERGDWGKPLPTSPGRRFGRGIACNAFHGQTHVAMMAEVSVGAANDLRVHRVVAAVDCGLVINPLGVEGQVESGITWGLSTVIGGEITFADGAVQQSSFADYPVVRLSQAPAVEVHVVPGGEAPLGLGEPPVLPVAPAVCNAVFAAIGRRVRRLPLRL